MLQKGVDCVCKVYSLLQSSQQGIRIWLCQNHHSIRQYLHATAVENTAVGVFRTCAHSQCHEVHSQSTVKSKHVRSNRKPSRYTCHPACNSIISSISNCVIAWPIHSCGGECDAASTEAYLWDSTHSCGDDHEASSSSLYNGHAEGLCQGCIDEDVTPHLPMQSSQQCRHVLLQSNATMVQDMCTNCRCHNAVHHQLPSLDKTILCISKI